jgi:exopolyphosphatase/guanosine-5'-triphosphate,3'-diphosphate pyrophosphatase
VAGRLEHFHPSEGAERVAAVDLGTNSIRLLVVEPRPATAPQDMPFVELARDMVITRIGQGVDRNGRIQAEALDRTVAVLERYGRRARALGARTIRVTATSAVRDAASRVDLDAAVLRHAGSELRVASGEAEAELSFLGATWGLEAPRPVCVLDIGGGSTEFVVGSDRPRRRASTQMGSVRLTERHVRHDPPTDDELDRMIEAVDEVLEEVEGEVAPGRARTLVAVAGTSTTVQAVGLDLWVYDPEAIHRTELPLDRAEAVLDRLASMTTAERAALPVMAPGREDVIVAGATILVQVMRRFGFDRTVVSERDVLDGLILEALGEQPPPAGSEGSGRERIR